VHLAYMLNHKTMPYTKLLHQLKLVRYGQNTESQTLKFHRKF